MQNEGFQINFSDKYLYFSEILEVTQKVSLVVELELKAVSAVELLPIFGVGCPELPGPVQVLHVDYFLRNLLCDIVNILWFFSRQWRCIKMAVF